MKAIDQIIISCWKGDVWLTRICVASIRYWYPDIPIGLIKDFSQGEFSTAEIEATWNVSVVAVPNPPRGIFTKMEAFHLPGRQRILLLDSDTVFLGKLLNLLGQYEEDFVGNWGGTLPLNREEKRKYALNGYYDWDSLQKILPDFEPPDYFFNSGHLLITSSMLPRDRFQSWLNGTPPKETAGPDFAYGDQGLINLVLAQMQQEGKCTLGYRDFVRWSIHPEMVEPLELSKISSREGYPFLIHWAEKKTFHKTGFIRGDILGFYEDFYYSRIPHGAAKRNYRLLRRAHKGITPKVRAIAKMGKKKIDLRELLRNEACPAKERNPCAYVS